MNEIRGTRRIAINPISLIRVLIVLFILVAWELLAQSGLLFRDVVPSLFAISKALLKILASNDYYGNLGWTLWEVMTALLIGGLSGLACGLLLGINRFLSRSFEPYIYYLGPTPKIIFFPVMIMWFGVGPGSKVALGAISCFFPIALSIAAGVREVPEILVRVGHSFRSSIWQMTLKVYLPAMRGPVINGIRLGLGIALIGVLLAETKLSNRGIGYLIIQAYARFDMPNMYAHLILLFVIAIGLNHLIARLEGSR